MAQLMGVKAEVSRKYLDITKEISELKAVVSRDEEVRRAMEHFQSVLTGRLVRSYENLLSKLIEDILPAEIGTRVRMDLSTHMGAPALDVLVERAGMTYDVMASEGGALTNVICLGLRLIATIRSAKRPFLLLDEADHWLEVDRVKDFYAVLAEVSHQMGLQVLAITHKDIAHIRDANPRIIRVDGDPRSEKGLSLKLLSAGRSWDSDTQPGIRSIELMDFAGYAKTVLELSPGLNVIIGSNNKGKSRFQRALSVLAMGGGRDEDIRAFRQMDGSMKRQRSCSVRVTSESGAVEWTRSPGKTPVEIWRRYDSANNILETHGKSVPEWVDDVIGIQMRAGLDIQLWNQKKGPFLFGETPSRRAEVLNVGRESSILNDMMKLHRKDVVDAKRAITHLETELRRLDARRIVLDRLGDCEKILMRLERGAEMISQNREHARTLKRIFDGMTSIHQNLKYNQRLSDILKNIGLPPEIDMRSLEKTRQIAERLFRIRGSLISILRGQEILSALPREIQMTGHHERKRLLDLSIALKENDERRLHIMKTLDVFKVFDNPPPSSIDEKTTVLREIIIRMNEAKNFLVMAQKQKADAEEGLKDLASEWRVLTMGKPCPTCGKPMSGHIGEDEHDFLQN
jgi:recombinational DNA repair ATPase RecF